MTHLKSPEEIEIMTEGGRHLAVVLKKLVASVRIGMTTKELDTLAFDFIKGEGCKPSFLNYRPAGAKGVSRDAVRLGERCGRTRLAVRLCRA